MNKDERKEFNKEVTLDYLKQAEKGQHVAEIMTSKIRSGTASGCRDRCKA
jgi:hypothetical protein